MGAPNFDSNQLGFPLYVHDNVYSKVCPECGAWNMAEADVCECCGWEAPWDGGDDDHGSMWECEECGKHFCTKCFTDRWGRKAWDKMMQGMVGSFETERLFCPECYGEIIRDYPEKEA